MEKKIGWDDISTLQLELDDNYSPEETQDLRTVVRLDSRDLLEMLMDNVQVIYVQVVTRKGRLPQRGVLQDISQKGLGFVMTDHGLQKNELIRIATKLGNFVLKTNAIVRWVANEQVGVEYFNPKAEDVSFLSELYSTKIFNRI